MSDIKDTKEHHHHHNCCCGHEHIHPSAEHHEAHHSECTCGHSHEHSPEHRHVHSEHSHVHTEGSFTYSYIIENLGCANCAAKMESRIASLPGVSAAVLTFATKQLRVSTEKPMDLLSQIQSICSSIESQVVVTARTSSSRKTEEEQKQTHPKHRKELTEIGTGAVLFVLGLILEHMNAHPLLPILLFVTGYLMLGGRILLAALKNISRGQIFDENFLMSIATLGAFGIKEYPEAVGVMLFYRIGEFFEHQAVEKSRNQIMEAIDLRPDVVNRMTHHEIETIPAEDAKIGDLLLIRPGDRIPLDGVVTEGNSRIDTSPITGEPVPRTVSAGSEVISGCINISGQLTLRVSKTLEESMVTRILHSVEHAAASKPKIDRFITRFARIYTPFVVCIALLTAVVPSLLTGDWNYWIFTALTFLVISCPCALVLSVPLAFFSGIGAGSKKGILFKGGASIEALNHIKAVVMDKTGTLTKGNFAVQNIITFGHYTEEELLSISAGCESLSTHPIAHSIVSAARERGLAIQKPDSMEELAGLGIAARQSGNTILCGSKELLKRHGVPVNISDDSPQGAEVYLAVNQKLAGYFIISDTVKPDAKSAVEKLRSMGLYIGMLTGDSINSALAVAKEVGISHVYAKLLPQEKLEKLSQIRQDQGAVLFIGDGINDAPVLAGADVGAAMGSGADAALEAADTVFMTSKVSSIPEAIYIAKATNRIALQNVVFALVIKLMIMILGLLGYANMWMAVFADTGVAMLCVINSIRILYRK